MKAKEQLDKWLDAGRQPVFTRIRLTDVVDFAGQLKESPSFYNSMTLFPEVVIGSYRGVTLILNVKAV